VAIDAGNLVAVAKLMREKFSTAKLIIGADNDESGTGQRAGEDAARAVKGLLAIPQQPGRDWNDIAVTDGAGVVRAGVKAAAAVEPQVSQPDREQAKSEPGRVILVPASDIKMRPVSWLWDGWLAGGKLHILGGVPGTGKTTIALGIAATLTTGGRWPDGAICSSRRSVIVWSGEDSADDTLVPRLAAAGADLSRVRIVSSVSHEDGQRPFDPSRDMQALIEAAQAIGDVGLLVLDPVVMSVQGDSHKNAEVRRGLQPIVDFAERLNAAALGITHFSKGTSGRDPLDRITGSLAFGAAPRLVWAAAKEYDDDGEETGRVLARLKSNIGPDGGGVRYSFLQAEPDPGVTASLVLWGETVEGTAREILGQPDNASDDPEEAGRGKARVEAETFLRDLLKSGPVAVDTIRQEAKQAGIPWRTVERAKPHADIVALKTGFGSSGKWTWRLSDAPKTANSPIDRHHSGKWRPLDETAEKHPQNPVQDPKTASVGRVEGNGGLSGGDVAVLGEPPDAGTDSGEVAV
jgi:putative DNA primase/helicase